MVLTVILCLCFAALVVRLVDLQWIRHEELLAKADRQHDRSYLRQALRGDIRDQRGQILATSVPVKNICANPFLLYGHEAEMARTIAPFLRTNEAVVLNLLNRHERTNSFGEVVTNQFVLLKNLVAVEDWEKIQAAVAQQYTNAIRSQKLSKAEQYKLRGTWLRSIQSRDEQIRTYPNGALAAHVLGFTGPAPLVVNGQTNTVMAGLEGIERTFDEKVRGTRGWVKTEVDRNRQELFIFREQDVASRPGLNVVLTIDARVQQIVEEELATVMAKFLPQSVSAIVIRPRTGEIVAMATLPNFDPNQVGRFRPEQLRNRIITDSFEPGSTFKTITLAGALDGGVVRLTDTIDCEGGVFHFAGRTLHDHGSDHFGTITVEKIIAHSSNVGTAKVAIKMGQARTYDYIWNFGFGQRTGIPLTGESPGILPRLKDWKPIHISRIPIGQGVAATPLQTAMAVAAVANGGVLMRPMLVSSLVDDKGQTVAKYQSQTVRRVCSEAAALQTVKALKSVVEEGTAEKAKLEHYTVAGKTGTAQKVVNGEYSHEKYYSSFIGFFPADNPELCIYVSVDEPQRKLGYYGSLTAAPAFKHIAERAANFLNIKPDLHPGQSGDVMASDKFPDSTAVTQLGVKQ